MAILMANHAKNGPQDAPGGGRCRSIGRWGRPHPNPRARPEGEGIYWGEIAARALALGRGMSPIKEGLGLAGGRPHPNPPPIRPVRCPLRGRTGPNGVVMAMTMTMAMAV